MNKAKEFRKNFIHEVMLFYIHEVMLYSKIIKNTLYYYFFNLERNQKRNFPTFQNLTILQNPIGMFESLVLIS